MCFSAHGDMDQISGPIAKLARRGPFMLMVWLPRTDIFFFCWKVDMLTIYKGADWGLTFRPMDLIWALLKQRFELTMYEWAGLLGRADGRRSLAFFTIEPNIQGLKKSPTWLIRKTNNTRVCCIWRFKAGPGLFSSRVHQRFGLASPLNDHILQRLAEPKAVK